MSGLPEEVPVCVGVGLSIIHIPSVNTQVFFAGVCLLLKELPVSPLNKSICENDEKYLSKSCGHFPS